MRLKLVTKLPCTYEDAVAHVKTPRLLRFVAEPLVDFTPLAPPAFPREWSAGTYWVGLKLFRFLPFGWQAVVVSFPSASVGFVVRDNGHSPLVSTWDHRITITPTADGTIYEDQVDISAGLLTPFVWLFASMFYRHRQRRWRVLAASGFRYGDARHPVQP